MIVQVIPLRRMPFEIFFLDYEAPIDLQKKIKIGSLAIVPFRNKKIFAIISSLKPSESEIKKEKIKIIDDILLEQELIPQSIIDYIIDFCYFYRVSPGIILKNLSFKLIKKNILLANSNLNQINQNKPLLNQKPILYNYKTIDDRNIKIEKILSEIKGQKLILAPTVEGANNILDSLPKNIKNKSILITGETTDKNFFEKWLKIRNNEDVIVVGTRRALFLPWVNLNAVIMDEEGDLNYKSWDMAPRFNTRDALLLLSKYTNNQIYFFAHTPSVESYFFAKKNIYKLDGDIGAFKKPSPIFLRYLKNTKKTIDDDVIDALSRAKKSGFIYINRKADYSSVICKDCGFVFRCNNCSRAFSSSRDNAQLNCQFCSINNPLPSHCPKCASPDFVFLGQGIKSIASEIKKLLPNKNIIVISKESEFVELGNISEPNTIVIGTEFARARIDWSTIDVFVMIDSDFSLTLAEYKATEDLWQKIRQAQFLLNTDANFFIQTANQEHYVYSGVYNPNNFYSKELLERKKFGYPPFKYLIRLLIGSSNKNSVDIESKKALNKISSLTLGQNNVNIIGPLNTNPPFYRGQYWQALLLKADYANYKKITKNIAKLTLQTWKFDPNPNSILSIS